jgi:hypothetical protein
MENIMPLKPSDLPFEMVLDENRKQEIIILINDGLNKQHKNIINNKLIEINVVSFNKSEIDFIVETYENIGWDIDIMYDTWMYFSKPKSVIL